MKNLLKKTSIIVLIVAMILQMFPAMAFANDEGIEDGVAEIDNNYVLVRINSEDGRFSVKTKEGSPLREGDEDKSLLFEEIEPETSYTTFRIDGEDYIYGNDYGFLGLDGSLAFDESVNTASVSTWNIGDFEITQSIEVIDDTENINAGKVKISYEATNTGDQALSIGSRILLDTMLGGNDGAPVILGNEYDGINYEKEIVGEELPQYWRTMDDVFSPSVIAFGFLDGWGNTKPSRMIIGHYEGLSTTKWDYHVDSSLRFTRDDNKYGGADSGVAMYWDPEEVNSGESLVFETYYGIGSVAKPDEDIDFNINIYAIDKLTLNKERNGYNEEYFTISGEIDNELIGASTLEDVQLSLILDDGLELKRGQVPYINVPLIQANEKYSFEFDVKASARDDFKVLKYRLDVTAKGMNDPVSFGDSVLAPGLKGTPPDIRVQSVLPSKIYNQGEKIFVIDGSGFDVYSDKNQWTMYLENTVTGGIDVIGQEHITVGDNSITVTYPGQLELGEYRIVLDYWSTSIGDVSVPFEIEITDDIKYRSKSYGIIAIEKIVDLSSDGQAEGFEYNVVTLENEEALDKLEDDIEANNHIGSSAINKLLMVIRGNVVAIGADDSIKYIVNSDNNPVSINSIVQYKGQPINIVENNDGVLMNGNGKLKLADGFTFWKWEFETELENGKDYSLNAKGEEEIDLMNPDNINELIAMDDEYIYMKDKVRDAQENVELDFLGKGTIVKNIGGFLIQIENIVLGDEAVSFGGQMALSFIPQGKKKENGVKSDNKTPFDLSAEIENVLFEKDEDGNAKFKGIDAKAEISLPEDMVGGFLSNGNVGMLSINTIDNIYSIEGDVSIKVIECHGLFTIIHKRDKYFLDDLELRLGVPKIHLGSPFMAINSLGGGINNLYGTLSGDKTAPPLKIILAAGFELVDDSVFEGYAKLSVSKVGFTLEGALELVPIDSKVLKNFHVTTRWVEPMYLEAGAELYILDIVTGNANIYVSGKWFEGRVKAAIQVPRSAPIIGGMRFASAEMGLNTKKVWGNVGIEIWVPIWGNQKIGVGCAYYWDDGLKISDAGNRIPGREYALYEETILDEENKPIRMMVGTNIKKLGDSSSSLILASRDMEIEKPLVYASLDKTTHYFTVYNQDVAIFQIDYDGELPELELYRPDGTKYELTNEGGEKAYIVQEADDKNHVYIFIPNADNGQWKLETDKKGESALLNLEQPPTFESIEIEEVDEDADERVEKIKVIWDSVNDEDAKINISLTQNKEDAGILVESGIDASLGQYTFEVPDGLTSGDYFVRVEIVKGDFGYESKYSEVVKLSDSYDVAEIDIDSLSVEAVGNGNIEVAFTHVENEDVVGYFIEIFDESGNKVENAGEYFVNQGEDSVLIGGKYKVDQVVDDDGNIVVEEEYIGLDTNSAYIVAISTLAEKDGVSHLSETVYSETVFVPQADPAEINIELLNDFERVVESGEEIMVINEDVVELDFNSDQTVDVVVIVDEYELEKFSGDKYTISITPEDGWHVVEILTENEKGDTSSEILSFMMDREGPLLQVERLDKEDGLITAKGITEVGSVLTVNGIIVDIDEDGIFEYKFSESGSLKEKVIIESIDKAMNSTVYETELLMSNELIESVYISPQIANLVNYTSSHLELIGVTEQGNEYILNSDLVDWDIMKGKTLVQLTDEGILESYGEGQVIVKGAYYVDGDYAFEDAIKIEITENDIIDEIVSVQVKPEKTRIEKGDSQQFKVVGLDIEGNEIAVDKSITKWSIISGQSLGSISDQGFFQALEIGNISIKGRLEIPGKKVEEDTLDIEIYEERSSSSSNNKNKDSISSELQRMLNSIIAEENNLILIKTSNVKADEDNRIYADGRLNIVIEKGSISSDDAILIGKVKDLDGELKGIKSDVYEFQLARNKGKLQKAVEITFEIDEESIEDIENIAIYYYNEKYGKWQYLGGKVTGNKISVEVDHFSKYAVFDNSEDTMDDMTGRWSEKYVMKLASLGIVKGVEKEGVTYMQPERNITRLELATIVSRVMNLDYDESKTDFIDWDEIPDWGKYYVATAYANGWIQGRTTEEGKVFAYDEFATRAETVTIIGRLYQDIASGELDFEDNEDIPEWARQYVSYLTSSGIVSGYPDGTFRPEDFITREEVSKLIAVFMD